MAACGSRIDLINFWVHCLRLSDPWAIRKSRTENVHLFAGMPSGCLDHAKRAIEVKQAASTDGPVSFRVRRNEDNGEARISLDRTIRTKAVELHSPVRPETDLAEVRIKGKPWTSVHRLKNVPTSGLSGDICVLVVAK